MSLEVLNPNPPHISDSNCIGCETVNVLRNTLDNLAQLLLTGSVPGDEPHLIIGELIEMICVREISSMIGDEGSVNILQLPSGISFQFPSNVILDGVELYTANEIP